MTTVATAAWRGIATTVLDAAGVTIAADGLVTIPCRSLDGRTLRSRVIAPSGTRWWAPDGEGVHLFGIETLAKADHGTPVLITEGESDALAVREHLPGYLAVGAPGARTFKSEWRAIFEEFDLVYAIGDGDQAGIDFVWSVRRAIPWARPVVCPEDRDLRDLLQAGDRDVLDALLADADAMARLEHAVLHAADLDECECWLREGIPA